MNKVYRLCKIDLPVQQKKENLPPFNVECIVVAIITAYVGFYQVHFNSTILIFHNVVLFCFYGTGSK